jgi:hypothetical protein
MLGLQNRVAACLLWIAAASGLSSSGCVALAGDQDSDVGFPVKPLADFTWNAWNEITVGEEIEEVTSAKLLAVTFDTVEPIDTPDLSYLTSLRGEVVNGELRALFCTATSFPPEEKSVVGDVHLEQDLMPFVQGGDTIRLEWTGTVDPAYPMPPDGMRVRARIKVEVE